MKLFSKVILIFITSLMFSSQAAFAENSTTTEVTLLPSMTIEQVATKNQVPLEKLLANLNLSAAQAQTSIEQLSLSPKLVDKITTQLKIESTMEKSKNWQLIFTKFILWFALLIFIGVALAKGKVSPKLRWLFILLTPILFGFILGSDPNPLGTVKDGLVLYGSTGVIFKPRIVALIVLLVTIALGSRIFCGWACHFGVLEELFFKIPGKKFKLPFWLTNGIRVISFVFMLYFALGFGLDMFGYVDPFTIFGLQPHLTNLIFVIFILLVSIFVYRPWCNILCPFGLLAWLLEKVSVLKIRINPHTCTNCGACHQVCPTGAIIDKQRDQLSSNCYACGQCLNTCPNGSITYGKKA